jgi:hypothetical protein
MVVTLALLLMLQGAPAAPAGQPAQPGTISGELRTPDGSPAAGVRVSALPAPRGAHNPSDGPNYYATGVATNTVVSDLQGRYRLRNLPPGRYIILASGLGYPTYYPSTDNPDNAEVVTVEDRPLENVNVSVVLPPGGRVTGHVPPLTDGTEERAVLSGLELGEILESPVDANGNFTFGHVPEGPYLLSLFPTPPGMPSHVLTMAQQDQKVELVRPKLYTVSGRIVVPNGPLPFTFLEFYTDRSYVTARIRPDGSFTAQLQPAVHQIDMAGMIPGYGMASATLNGKPLDSVLTVGTSDVSGVEVTMSTPKRLGRVLGKVVGVPSEKLAGARVELTGRIISTLQATVRPDGSFEFPAVAPGGYWMRLLQAPDVPWSYIVVGDQDLEVQLGSRPK